MPKRRKRPPPPSMDPIGTPDGPLTTRFSAEGGLRADATVVRAASHKEMLSWIGVLERLIVLPRQRLGIGHNLQPFTDVEDQEIKHATAILKAQPVVPTAPDQARAAGSTLKKVGERLGTYLDACLMEASKSAGKELGKQVGRLPFWLALYYALMKIAQSVANWLG